MRSIKHLTRLHPAEWHSEADGYDNAFHNLPTYTCWADVPLWKKVLTYALYALDEWTERRLLKLGVYW